jgi:hypothetical protein
MFKKVLGPLKDTRRIGGARYANRQATVPNDPKETDMNRKQSPSTLRPATHFVAAALAGIIATGIFVGVTVLFQRDGRPLERLVAAERACMGHAYVSERAACMREWAAAARSASLASK